MKENLLNKAIDDGNLSFSAVGLYAQIIHQKSINNVSDEVEISTLFELGLDDEVEILNIIDELVEGGYLLRVETKKGVVKLK